MFELGTRTFKTTVKEFRGKDGLPRPEWMLSLSEVCAGVVVGNRPETWAVLICFLCLISGVSKHVCALHEWSLGFL